MNKKRTDAVEILHRRYVGDDAERKAAVDAARVHAEVARTIYRLRTEEGLSQKQLAELLETSQSAISRLEDEDYEGHSLAMLNRIAQALNGTLTVAMTARSRGGSDLQYAFRLFLRNLRRREGLTVEELADKTGIGAEELAAAERDWSYRLTPQALHKLSEFYGLPEGRLAALAGPSAKAPSDIAESAGRYADQSDASLKLTRDERQALDRFMDVLKRGA